jgi:hypothetical protein
VADWPYGPNADGTPAEDLLRINIPLITSRGPVTLGFVLTDGDARNLATSPADQLAWMGPVVWEQMISNVVAAVGEKDHEAGP